MLMARGLTPWKGRKQQKKKKKKIQTGKKKKKKKKVWCLLKCQAHLLMWHAQRQYISQLGKKRYRKGNLKNKRRRRNTKKAICLYIYNCRVLLLYILSLLFSIGVCILYLELLMHGRYSHTHGWNCLVFLNICRPVQYRPLFILSLLSLHSLLTQHFPIGQENRKTVRHGLCVWLCPVSACIYIFYTELMACARFSSDGIPQNKQAMFYSFPLYFLFLFFPPSLLGCVISSQSTAGTKLALIYGIFIQLGVHIVPSLSLFFFHFLFWEKINKLWLIYSIPSFPSIVCRWPSSWNDWTRTLRAVLATGR